MSERTETLLAELVELHRRQLANQEAAIEAQRASIELQRHSVEQQRIAITRQRRWLLVLGVCLALVMLRLLPLAIWSTPSLRP